MDKNTNSQEGGFFIGKRKVSAKTFFICLPFVLVMEAIGRGLLNRLEDDLAKTVSGFVEKG